MEKLIYIYYIKSANSDEKKIKILRLENLCADIESSVIKSCNSDELEKMFYKEHIISSPYSDELTLLKFSEKLNALRKIYNDKKLLDNL